MSPGSVKHDEHIVFSLSMAFFPTNRQPEPVSGESIFLPSDDLPGGYLNHGWLDDTIVVGAGLRDEVCNSILVDVATALRGHTLCTVGNGTSAAEAAEIREAAERREATEIHGTVQNSQPRMDTPA
jgi:hypothetical protein